MCQIVYLCCTFQYFVWLLSFPGYVGCLYVYICGTGEIPRGGPITTKKRARVPTHPPVTAVGNVRTRFVACQPYHYVLFFLHSEALRRIRSEYTHIVMRDVHLSVRMVEKRAGAPGALNKSPDSNGPRTGVLSFNKGPSENFT